MDFFRSGSSNLGQGMSSVKDYFVSGDWGFHKIVICIAIITLIISLVIIGHYLRNSKSNSIYPPVVSNCPDYWEEKIIPGNANNRKHCVNNKEINNGKPDTVKVKDFNSGDWQGFIGRCRKQQWAVQNELTWDGVTNNPKLCSYSNY